MNDHLSYRPAGCPGEVSPTSVSSGGIFDYLYPYAAAAYLGPSTHPASRTSELWQALNGRYLVPQAQQCLINPNCLVWQRLRCTCSCFVMSASGPRAMTPCGHGAHGDGVMARVRSTNKTLTDSVPLWLLHRFALRLLVLVQPEVDWTEHSAFAACLLQAACQGATALIPEFFTCLTMLHLLFAVIG